jgi:hypothetical protein
MNTEVAIVLPCFNQTWLFVIDFSEIPSIKLHKNPSSTNGDVPFGQTDSQTDITWLLKTAAFCNFLFMPKDQFPVLIHESPDLHDSDSGKYQINVIL